MRNPANFREWWKIIFRVWRPALTQTEFEIVLFVFDRTAGWGKEWECIPTRHFGEGVVGGDGVRYAAGVQRGRTTISTTLARLKRMGCLLHRQEGNRHSYALDYSWEPTRQPLMGLPEPKKGHRAKRQEMQTLQGRGVQPTEHRGVQPVEHHNTLTGKGRSSLRSDASGGGAGEQDAGERIKARALAAFGKSRERREVKKSRLTPDGLTKVWTDACRSSDAPQVSVTKADAAILARYGKRFEAANPGTPFRGYLEWCVEEWASVRSLQFGWMGGASPSAPSIRFLVKFSDRFEQEWRNRDTIRRRAAMTDRERAVARRRDRGVSGEEAEAAVTEAEKLREERQRLAADRAEGNRRRREIERRMLDASGSGVSAPADAPAPRTGGTFDEWK